MIWYVAGIAPAARAPELIPRGMSSVGREESDHPDEEYKGD